MNNQLEHKRIYIFIAIAFGLAWIVGLVVFLTGGIVNSPEIIPGTQITLAYVLIAVAYMWAPGLANIFTRIITREGWKNTWLRPRIQEIMEILAGSLASSTCFCDRWCSSFLFDPTEILRPGNDHPQIDAAECRRRLSNSFVFNTHCPDGSGSDLCTNYQ